MKLLGIFLLFPFFFSCGSKSPTTTPPPEAPHLDFVGVAYLSLASEEIPELKNSPEWGSDADSFPDIRVKLSQRKTLLWENMICLTGNYRAGTYFGYFGDALNDSPSGDEFRRDKATLDGYRQKHKLRFVHSVDIKGEQQQSPNSAEGLIKGTYDATFYFIGPNGESTQAINIDFKAHPTGTNLRRVSIDVGSKPLVFWGFTSTFEKTVDNKINYPKLYDLCVQQEQQLLRNKRN